MKQNLAINFILLLLFTTSYSCSTSKYSLGSTSYNIINKEIDRNIYHYKNENIKKIYLDFTLNRQLIEFINKQDSNNPYSSTLREKIKESVYNNLFNETELSDYLSQLDSISINLKKVSLPKNVIYEKSKESTANKIIESSKFRIKLSNPVFSKNKKYCLISFSNGYEGSMIGGINIYEKNGDNWSYYNTINEWIE